MTEVVGELTCDLISLVRRVGSVGRTSTLWGSQLHPNEEIVQA